MLTRLSGLVLLSLLLASLHAVAVETQAPIAEDVLGCFYRVERKSDQRDTPASLRTVFVFRNQGRVVDPFGQASLKGKMVAVRIEHSSNQGGVTRSALIYGEGTTELFVPPSESSWTYSAPKGTVFTARGNFSGFFLSRNEKGIPVGWFASIERNGSADALECTRSEADLLKWCAIAKEDARSLDLLGLTNWCE